MGSSNGDAGMCNASPPRNRGEMRSISPAEWYIQKMKEWYRSPDARVFDLATLPFGFIPKAGAAAAAVGIAALGTKVATARPGYVYLYHGTKSFKGSSFNLVEAVTTVRAGTHEAGVYLTDDVARAMTGYGRGHQIVRVEVPINLAAAHLRMGPFGLQEFHFATSEAVSTLNAGKIRVYSWSEAITAWMSGLL